MPALPHTVPDVAGVIEGWRTWTLKLGEHRLRSITRPLCRWPAYRCVHATCEESGFGDGRRWLGGGSSHPAPTLNCTCGLYSIRQPDNLIGRDLCYGSVTEVIYVLGRVANWGTVIEHDDGWRAQYAYPLALYLPRCYMYLADSLAVTYGVPVWSFDMLDPCASR